MGPLIPILLGLGAVALLVKSATASTTEGSGGGGTGATCSMNGEQLSAALGRLDALSASTGGTKTGSVIMAALGNPMAKSSDMHALATTTRKLKSIGYSEADPVADCIDARANELAKAGN